MPALVLKTVPLSDPRLQPEVPTATESLSPARPTQIPEQLDLLVATLKLFKVALLPLAPWSPCEPTAPFPPVSSTA